MMELVQEARLVRNARELQVYKLAFSLALDVHKASLNFPKIEQYALADQMRRASRSICANLAEGFARQISSKAELGRFVTMAISSAEEMQVWCEFAYALEYISENIFKEWADRYDQVARMLTNFKNKQA